MNNKGFTLLELVLYIAIVSIMLASLIPFAWDVIGIGVKSSSGQEVYDNARLVSEKIKYEIRNSSNITTGSSNFDVNLATNGSYKLTLANSVAGSNPTVISITGGKVMIKRGASSVVTLNSTDTTVTNLTFTNYTSADNKTKHIGFTLTLGSNTTSTSPQYISTMTLETSTELMSN